MRNSLQYRARLDTGKWSDWVDCNSFVGTSGMSRSLTGLTVRLKGNDQFRLLVIGAFDHEHGLVIVEEGEDCVSKSGKSPLYGMQIVLRPV